MLLSHSRSVRFVIGRDQVFGCLGDKDPNRTQLVTCLWARCCVARAPKCRCSLGWRQELLPEPHNSLGQLNQAVKALCSQSSSGPSEVMLVEKDQSVGCICLCAVVYLRWQTFVVQAQRERATGEWDDVGIFPSALLVLLPICVTGLV